MRGYCRYAVICELLGLPPADRPKFIAWANSMAHLTNAFGFLRLIGGLFKMRRYLQGRLQVAREEGGEGLIAELVRVEQEGGRITPGEMVSMVFLLLGAGSETTTHLISGSVFELLKDPARRDWLAADWSRAGLAVEEFLRFVSPVQFSKPRYVRRDVDLEGVKLKKGDRVMAMLVAANLDAEANECPERLDLDRRPNRHLSFGTGIHFCLGHQLARIEAICALQALFTRWPGLKAGGRAVAGSLAEAAGHSHDRGAAGDGRRLRSVRPKAGWGTRIPNQIAKPLQLPDWPSFFSAVDGLSRTSWTTLLDHASLAHHHGLRSQLWVTSPSSRGRFGRARHRIGGSKRLSAIQVRLQLAACRELGLNRFKGKVPYTSKSIHRNNEFAFMPGHCHIEQGIVQRKSIVVHCNRLDD